jgi:hypothetical protein
MLPATKEDKANVVHIIEESFKDTPSVTWVVKNDNKKEKRLKALAEYMFDIGYAKKGVFLSTDKSAIAIIFKFNNRINKHLVYYHELRLLFRAIGLRKLFSVLHRQAYLKAQKPASGNFLYFWLYGASDHGKGRGGALELQKEIYQLSADLGMPIYLETTVAQNKLVYERFGFQLYHTWQVEEQGINVWFMKREPK